MRRTGGKTPSFRGKSKVPVRYYIDHIMPWTLCSPHSKFQAPRHRQRKPKIDILTISTVRLSFPDNASRLCGWDGVWAERTDYSACKLLEQDTRVMEEVEMGADLEISIIIYLIGEMSRTDHSSITRVILIVKLNCLFVTSLDTNSQLP